MECRIACLKKGKNKIIFRIPKYFLATGSYSIKFDIAIPHVKKVNSEKIDLIFKVVSNTEYGNKYFVENSVDYNSIVRPNWFCSIESI